MSPTSGRSPLEKIRLVFIHHSCGGQLLAEAGPEDALDRCIYRAHPNGGGLRGRLESLGFEVHEASYGSAVGDRTDLFDWAPKFRDGMDVILSLDLNDRRPDDRARNQVVVWKSCFPNNLFQGPGVAPGQAQGPDLTVWNAKAALTAALPELSKYPRVLFVYMTAPPLAQQSVEEPAVKRLAKRMMGRPTAAQVARLAREFNSWVASPGGWLKDYPGTNVRVFDYFDLLTDHGKSDFLAYPTGGGADSHPSREGNRRAAEQFATFLGEAVAQTDLVVEGRS